MSPKKKTKPSSHGKNQHIKTKMTFKAVDRLVALQSAPSSSSTALGTLSGSVATRLHNALTKRGSSSSSRSQPSANAAPASATPSSDDSEEVALLKAEIAALKAKADIKPITRPKGGPGRSGMNPQKPGFGMIKTLGLDSTPEDQSLYREIGKSISRHMIVHRIPRGAYPSDVALEICDVIRDVSEEFPFLDYNRFPGLWPVRDLITQKLQDQRSYDTGKGNNRWKKRSSKKKAVESSNEDNASDEEAGDIDAQCLAMLLGPVLTPALIDDETWERLGLPESDEEWPCYPEDVREKWEKKDAQIDEFIQDGGELQSLDPKWWEKLLRTRFENEPETFEKIWHALWTGFLRLEADPRLSIPKPPPKRPAEGGGASTSTSAKRLKPSSATSTSAPSPKPTMPQPFPTMSSSLIASQPTTLSLSRSASAEVAAASEEDGPRSRPSSTPSARQAIPPATKTRTLKDEAASRKTPGSNGTSALIKSVARAQYPYPSLESDNDDGDTGGSRMADEGAQQTETGVVAPGSPLTDLDCELDAGEQLKVVKTGSAGKKRQLDALRLFSSDEDDEPVVPQKKTSTRHKPTAIMSDSESDSETRVHEKSAPQAKRNTQSKAGSSKA